MQVRSNTKHFTKPIRPSNKNSGQTIEGQGANAPKLLRKSPSTLASGQYWLFYGCKSNTANSHSQALAFCPLRVKFVRVSDSMTPRIQ